MTVHELTNRIHILCILLVNVDYTLCSACIFSTRDANRQYLCISLDESKTFSEHTLYEDPLVVNMLVQRSLPAHTHTHVHTHTCM